MKTKLMRLNEQETEIVEIIRNIGPDLVLGEFKNCYNEVLNKEEYFIIKRMIVALEEKEILDMEALVKSEFISREQSEYLIKAMEDNKNIIVVGESRAGKTALLNALLRYQKHAKTLVFERIKELDFNDEILEKDITICQETDSLSMKYIVTLSNDSRLVLGEISTSDDGLAVVGALKLGSSILATISCSRDCKSFFLDLFTDNTKQYAEEMLSKNKMILVEVEIDKVSGKKRVKKITEN